MSPRSGPDGSTFHASSATRTTVRVEHRHHRRRAPWPGEVPVPRRRPGEARGRVCFDEAMDFSVVIGNWPDRPPEEALHTAAIADRLRFRELWIGETDTWDAFALASAIGL